jgi:predicted DCC family thiol-disulfide oxidoreductase YuxK
VTAPAGRARGAHRAPDDALPPVPASTGPTGPYRGSPRQIWNRFWFTPVPLRRLGLFRLAFTLYALVDLVGPSRYMLRYSTDDPTFFHPIQIIKRLHLGPWGHGPTELVLSVGIAALILAVLGIGTQVACAVSAACYTWWFATFYSYGAVQHGKITVSIALWLCAITPSGATYSIDSLIRRAWRARPPAPLPDREDRRDAVAGWGLRLMMVLVVCAYTFGCYSKLRRQGLGWATGHALQRLIVEKHTWVGMKVAFHPHLLEVLQILTLILEGSAVVVFRRGRVRDFYFFNSSLFHIGTLFLLDINFSGLMLAYIAFYDLEKGADRISGAVRRRAPGLLRPVELVYDGTCKLCVRTIAPLRALDWFGLVTWKDGSGAGPMTEMTASDARGSWGGYDAFRRLAAALPLLWPAVILMRLPGVRPVGTRIYRYVAEHRGTNGSCGVDTCSLSALPPPARAG